MAEKIVSPGVFTNEVDQSFLPAGVQAIGAAVIGPTAKGPSGVPTVVSSYSEFVQLFGSAFSSGSGAVEQKYKYLTNYSAQEYLKYADTLTVVRVSDGASHATAEVGATGATTNQAKGALTIVGTFGQSVNDQVRINVNDRDYKFIAYSSPAPTDVVNNTYYFVTGSDTATFVDNLVAEINAANIGVVANDGLSDSILALTASAFGSSGDSITVNTGSSDSDFPGNATELTLSGGAGPSTVSFKLHTLSDGADQNSNGSEGTNGLLANGSENNLRYEISNRNTAKGTFTLTIRRGNDTNRRKVILEQYNNATLDPNTPNYIARLIGDQVQTLRDAGTTDPFLQLSGSYANRSKLVRVEVLQNTYNYLDENGNIRDGSLTSFIPSAQSGSFSGGSDGTVTNPRLFNENISNTNTQGYNLANTGPKNAYIDAIRLLKNQDEYDINLITLPGLVDNYSNHATVITEALNMCEDRGDCFFVIDPAGYSTALTAVTTEAEERDTNYAAMYWPWVKIPDAELNKAVWVPASTLIPSVYAFNDRVAAPWFAPAGLNRGGIDIAIQAERKLTQANRDTLYDSNVNPIATFPNTGVVVYGQKTLQKKSSALDRVNVRRLLINAKKFIASSSKFLVFEQNTTVTRNRFLGIVNPYFENVQQRQGLYAFRVVMDETTNTPDVIDRNEMRGQIFLQPAKTAEFIVIDFNVLPTGASFPE
jgi:hypothetical protein